MLETKTRKPDVPATKQSIGEGLQCPVKGCTETFERHIQLIGHCWNKHHKRVNRQGKILRGGLTEKQRRLRKAASGTESHFCPYCPKSFPSKFSLSAHLRRHKGEMNGAKLSTTGLPTSKGAQQGKDISIFGRVSYVCDVCGRKGFKSHQALSVHLSRSHNALKVQTEISRLQQQLARIQPAQPEVFQQPAGERMVIECCESCGYNVRLQNTMALVREEAIAQGKDVRSITVKFNKQERDWRKT